MSHEDAGHYAGKHPGGTTAHPEAEKMVRSMNSDGKISCTDAHKIASDLEIPAVEVGRTIDLNEIRIARCQLGLFGYKEKERNIVTPAELVTDKVKNRIMLDVKDNNISCLSLWNIAEELGMTKMETTAASEHMKLKICCCQLGAF
jgi:hypothetical protein